MLKLRLLTGPRAGRQLRVSDAKPVSIGRRVGRLRLHDSRVSKNHAEIYFANDMWVLRDLGSANGTYVNRKRAAGLVELEPGDLVQMGRVLFKVVRCDGIGMDTQPGLTDELLEEDGLDDAMGLGTARATPTKALPSDDEDDEQDDLDLDAMFGATQSDDANDANDDNDDSDIFAALDAPEVDKSPPADVYELEESAPELIQATVDVPDDDDDSFFSDLGEATDTTGGIGVAVKQSSDDDDDLNVEGVDAVTDTAQPGDLAEASDPFLSGDEEEDSNDSSDLISLEDESGMGPRNSGTTLLTVVPHDDLVNDESKADISAAIDPADEPELKEPAAAATDSDFDDEAEDFDDAYEDDDDGQAPALVGLLLNQAPPQQPDVLDADEDESAALDTEITATTGDDESHDEADEESVLALGEPVEVSTDESALADALLDEASDGLSAAAEDEDAEAFDITDALSDQDFDPEIQEALAELDDSDDAYDLAAFDDQTPDEDEDASDEEKADAIGSDVLDLTEVQAGLIDDEPEDVSGAFAAEPASDSAVTDAEPDDEPAAVAAGVPDDDELPEGAPVFDIDAAFDALSEGLDDSFELPAIGEDEQQQQSAEHAAADSLAGSQLDVDFIKDALAKLEETQGDSAQGPGDTSPKAAALPTMLPGSSSDSYFQSPPPGLNPSSLNPPVEPGRGYRPPSSSSGRWFFTLLLLLAIGGGGAWYITEHYEIQITGREDAGPASANASSPRLPGTPNEPADPTPTIEPAPPINQTPTPDQPTEPRHDGPDPFASGPVVLGQNALDGITRRNTAPPLPLIPVTNPDTTDRPDEPTTSTPEPLLPPAIEPGPVVVPDVADQPTEPAKPQAPARIVFLVDASGSLVDSLPQMLVWLNRAVQTIESDERFAIYFFKSGDPIGIKPEGMIEPTREVLNRISADWLSADQLPLLPSGRSNPTRAIAKALALNPTDIYLLSDDAFAFTQGDSTAEQALELVKDALGQSEARIHGVQFFYRSDNSVLETLANETKGTYEFVRESVVPNADPIDLLEELGGE